MGKDPRETGLPLSEYFDEATGFLTSGVTSAILAVESRVTRALVETEEKVGIT